MKWFIKCIKQYADFKGRARRQEFWMFTLFYCLASILVSMIFLPLFGSLLMLGLLVPSLAVNVRRLHDVGKSGLWMLLYLIPIVGVIWMLVYMVTEGNLSKMNMVQTLSKLECKIIHKEQIKN